MGDRTFLFTFQRCQKNEGNYSALNKFHENTPTFAAQTPEIGGGGRYKLF